MRALAPTLLFSLAAACAAGTPVKAPWPSAKAQPNRPVDSPSSPANPREPPSAAPRTMGPRTMGRASVHDRCAPLERRITIAVRRADLVSVLTFIADEAGLNLVVDSDVRGIVTTDLRDVTVHAALEALMNTYDLEAAIEGCILSAHAR